MKIKTGVLILFLLLYITGMGFPAAAAETDNVSDNAGLLSAAEIEEVDNRLSDLETKTGWEIFVVTIDDAQGYVTSAYNEKWLNEHLTGDDGISYIIDMENREYYLSTTGEPIRYLTDQRIDDIMDAGSEYIGTGAYADTFLAMIRRTESYYNAGIPGNQYNYDSDTGEISRYQEPKQIKWYEALIAAGLAAAAFGITFGAVVGKYRMKWGSYQYDYQGNSTVNITGQEDQFLNQVVTHRHIPRNTGTTSGGSSGRSTVHRGSGGRSYGGGGRKF